jgi:hypothetical protein
MDSPNSPLRLYRDIIIITTQRLQLLLHKKTPLRHHRGRNDKATKPNSWHIDAMISTVVRDAGSPTDGWLAA